MWPFKSVKNLREAGIFNGFTDWHSHILPGVDDGIKTIEDSLAVLKRYDELGVNRVWLTPHIMEDYPNQIAELQKVYEDLKRRWSGKAELCLASENMLDNLFEERLEKNELLTIGDEGSHILVETSYYTPPMGMNDTLRRVKSKGYFPVLAHPERYRYMEEADYRRLKEMDILFQMNIISLVGGYGETAQKKAEWLLNNGMIDMLGSDLHNLEAFERLIENSPRKSSYVKSILEVVSRQPGI